MEALVWENYLSASGVDSNSIISASFFWRFYDSMIELWCYIGCWLKILWPMAHKNVYDSIFSGPQKLHHIFFTLRLMWIDNWVKKNIFSTHCTTNPPIFWEPLLEGWRKSFNVMSRISWLITPKTNYKSFNPQNIPIHEIVHMCDKIYCI